MNNDVPCLTEGGSDSLPELGVLQGVEPNVYNHEGGGGGGGVVARQHHLHTIMMNSLNELIFSFILITCSGNSTM